MKVEYSADRKYAFFDGYKFRRDAKTGYYLSSKNTDIGKHERLHRYVWRYHNGDIPDGFHVHHKDEDKYNNEIENLVCIPKHDHISLHGYERAEREYDWIVNNLDKMARPKASEWHGSESGKEWHKQQYELTKEKFHVKRDYVCEYCGKPFKSTNVRSRYCSGACSAAARRKSGVDNEVRECQWCGKLFTVNRYAKTRTCSRKCSNKLRWYQERQEMR